MTLYSYQYEQLEALNTLSLFRQQVVRFPDKPAVCSIRRQLSYGKLDQLSSLLACQITNLTKASESPFLALLFEHDVEIGVAVLGSLKAGYGYLPLDAAYPLARLSFMLEQAGSPILLTYRKMLPLALQLTSIDRLLVMEDLLDAPTPNSSEDLLPAVIPSENPAYLLFTSGSTGNPKGLVQSHQNLIYHTWVWSTRLSITEQDKLSLQSAYSWDSSVQDLFAALLNGATLCFVAIKRDGLSASLRWMLEQRVSVYHSTIPLFRQVCRLLEDNKDSLNWSSLRLLAMGGDSVLQQDVHAWQRLFSPYSSLAYAYGSSESSTTLMKVIPNDFQMQTETLDLGEVAPGALVELVDDSGNIADEGEITLTSAYVVNGYLNQDIDPARFTRSADGRIRYRTGDLAKRLISGSYALLGRRDNQIKIRGIRVIPGEIESTLMGHRDIQEAVVMPFEDQSGERQLVAYIVFANGTSLNTSQLRDFLSERVPDHCLPARYIPLAVLPLTPNGKIDRNALPDVDFLRPELADKYIAPTSGLQQQLASIWLRVLQVENIGSQDNFFDLGGQSLKMTRVHSLLLQELELTIPLVKLYAYPTISSLAAYISNGDQSNQLKITANKRALKRQQLRRRATHAY